jgi:hypothetical protein
MYRPLEVFVVVSTLSGLIWRSLGWSWLYCVIMCFHFIVERPRWQMYPVYAAGTGVFYLAFFNPVFTEWQWFSPVIEVILEASVTCFIFSHPLY